MKRELIFMALLIPVIATATPKYQSTIEYIEKTQQLWGISSVIIETDGRVTLVDAKKTGFGNGMSLISSDKERVDKITLNEDEICVLADHHASITYLLKEINGASQLVFTVTDTLDARSFGDDIKETKKDLIVLPYKDENNPQQEP